MRVNATPLTTILASRGITHGVGVAQRELAESAVDVAAKAVAVLKPFPPLAAPAEP